MAFRSWITAAALALAATGASAEPIKALIITGHNNHNWQYTSRLHKDTLEATGRFAVDITDTPETTLADTSALGQYQVLVLDYNDSQSPKRWGDAAERAFLDAVNKGAGVVSIHSANNAFKGWTEYEKMIGLLWRDGTGHGAFHPFDVKYTDRDHPTTRGLADMAAHPDELYHRLVNSQKVEFHLLAQAFDDPDRKIGGSGQNEPMALTLTYGKGRIFATPLGHVWMNSPQNKPSISDPQFKILICRGTEWAATGGVTLGTTWADSVDHNSLTDAEKKAGWTSLFDGRTNRGWHGYKTAAFPENWTVKDGTLLRVPGKGGPDLVTDGEFGDFELACDFRTSPGTNSGIIYRCDEKHGASYETGPEYQVLDDPDPKFKDEPPKNRCATLYDLAAIPKELDLLRPAGEWNHARIVCKGTHIEHWLNGFKVVDVDAASPDFKSALAASKWAKVPDFNTLKKGHIALQDHGDEVAYRAVRVRRLD